MTNVTSARKTTATTKTAKPVAAKRAPASAKKPVAAKTPPAVKAPLAVPPKGKHKLVRDSFTIPKTEYLVLESLKLRAINLTRPAKKSELLRAGIQALSQMNDKAFLAALGGVPSLKTGRPKGAADGKPRKA